MSQPKFPLIEQIGLSVIPLKYHFGRYVDAADLERILESAPEVYGSNGLFGTEPDRDDKHIGKVVCIQTIKREPLKVEFQTRVGSTIFAGQIKDEKLLALDGKRVRVTVEEIGE